MINTFVSPGDRVHIYNRPYSNEQSEGLATVKVVHEQSDNESAFVAVEFDTEKGTTWDRWILPQHLEKTHWTWTDKLDLPAIRDALENALKQVQACMLETDKRSYDKQRRDEDYVSEALIEVIKAVGGHTGVRFRLVGQLVDVIKVKRTKRKYVCRPIRSYAWSTIENRNGAFVIDVSIVPEDIEQDPMDFTNL